MEESILWTVTYPKLLLLFFFFCLHCSVLKNNLKGLCLHLHSWLSFIVDKVTFALRSCIFASIFYREARALYRAQVALCHPPGLFVESRHQREGGIDLPSCLALLRLGLSDNPRVLSPTLNPQYIHLSSPVLYARDFPLHFSSIPSPLTCS